MMMIRLLTIILLITPIIVQNFEAQAQEPRNITRAENETDVFIPCPFGFQPFPSIWKINGTEYFGATLPSIFTQIPGGLFINTVHRCLNHTSFQCIDTSDDSLLGRESDIGFLTVTSPTACTGPGHENDEFFQAFSLGVSDIVFDHQRTVFGSINTTLAWVITIDDNSCTMSHILSYLPCQSSNTPGPAQVNVITNETEVTVQSENLRISGHLADFNISSLSEQPSAEGKCPILPVIIRVNVTRTKQLNLLVGNNNCTCVDIECYGSLYVAISKPKNVTNLPDALCPIHISQNTGPCYNPSGCNRLSGTPFFRVCESQNLPASSGCTYNMCFGNITEELNGTRLDFYVLNKTICDLGALYPARIYMLSFEINVKNASANVLVDTTAGEICFHSLPYECNLTRLTQYNVSITDLTGNLIFMNETIPESSCMNIQTVLRPQCYPFFMLVQPLNSFITYNSIYQPIQDDAGGTILDDICNCITKTVQEFRFTAVQETSLINIEYFCSTVYLTPLNITVIVSAGNKTLHQRMIVCSTGRFSVNSTLNQCGQIIDLIGYWTFTDINGTMSSTCSLSNYSILLPCPTMSPSPNSGTIIAVTVVIILLLILVIIAASLIIVKYRQLQSKKSSLRIQNIMVQKVQQSLHRENPQERANDTTDERDQDIDDETDGRDKCSDTSIDATL